MPQSATSHDAGAEDNSPSTAPGQKPVDRFREGSVHVSIWENDGPKGAFRTASFQLRYKDGQEQWRTGHSYAQSDLNHLEIAAREARARIENWHRTRSAKRNLQS